MRIGILITVAAAVQLAACSQSPQQLTPKSDEEKMLYALGAFVSEQMSLKNFDFTDQELAMVKSGVSDAAGDKASMDLEEIQTYLPKIQELLDTRMRAAVDRDKAAGAEYLATAAAEAGAEKTESGIVYRSVTEGTGDSPTAADEVRVHYEGRLISGKVFDSSKERGEPVTFPLGGVIPCWTEGLQKMKVGGSAQLVCPPEQAYGDQGNPSIPGGSTLVFDVDLLEIVKPEAAAATP